MSIFDQRNQNVNYQNNIAGDINLSKVNTKSELVLELRKIENEVVEASRQGAISEKISREAIKRINEVASGIENSASNKKKLIDRLKEAKALLEGIASASGLVTAIVKAIDVVKKIIP